MSILRTIGNALLVRSMYTKRRETEELDFVRVHPSKPATDALEVAVRLVRAETILSDVAKQLSEAGVIYEDDALVARIEEYFS